MSNSLAHAFPWHHVLLTLKCLTSVGNNCGSADVFLLIFLEVRFYFLKPFIFVKTACGTFNLRFWVTFSVDRLGASCWFLSHCFILSVQAYAHVDIIIVPVKWPCADKLAKSLLDTNYLSHLFSRKTFLNNFDCGDSDFFHSASETYDVPLVQEPFSVADVTCGCAERNAFINEGQAHSDPLTHLRILLDWNFFLSNPRISSATSLFFGVVLVRIFLSLCPSSRTFWCFLQ